MNVMQGEIRGGRCVMPFGSLDLSEGYANLNGDLDRFVSGMCPESIKVAPAAKRGGSVRTVRVLQNMGTQALVSTEVDSVIVRAVAVEVDEPEPGTDVGLRPLPPRGRISDAETGNLEKRAEATPT